MKRLAAVTLTLLVVFAAPCFAGSQTPSGATAQTIINRVRVIVNDSSSALVSDAEMLVWVDEAVKRTVKDARCLETTDTITLVAGTPSYTTSVAHYDIVSAVWDSGDATATNRFFYLRKLNPEDAWFHYKEAGRPQFWWEWGGSVYLWPVPTSDEAGDVVTLLMVTQPTGTAALSSAIETPYYLDEAITYYVAGKYHEADSKDGRAAHYRQMFDAEIAKARIEIRNDLTTVTEEK